MEAIKRYRLVIGAIALLAMVGLAIWAIRQESGDTQVVEEETPALPEIERDAITEVEIRLPGEEAIRLVKSGETWRLAAPIEAPAAQTTVDTVLDKLADLEVNGIASAHARFHERFEVDEEHGVHVIARAGSDDIIDFWIGGARGGNTMLRLDGEEQTLLVEGSIKFAFNKPAQDFRDRAIVELEADDVREATFTNTNGTFHFRKSGEAWEHVLEPAAEGAVPAAGAVPPVAIERFAPTKVGTAVSGLARLRASSFAAPDVTVETAGLGESAPRVVLVSGEGESAQTVTLRVGNEVEGGSRYVMREGNDTLFVVSSFMATRLLPNTDAFQEAEPGTEPAEPAEPPPGMGMPGMPGMPGGGGQIPPELMQQIQRQLQQQQAGGGGAHGH
jgi:hypothetical protein